MQAAAGAASGGPRESLGAPLCANGWRGPPKAKTADHHSVGLKYIQVYIFLKTGWGPIRGKETAPSAINLIFQHLRFVFLIFHYLHVFHSCRSCSVFFPFILPFFSSVALQCSPCRPIMLCVCSMSLSPALELHCLQVKPNQRTAIWSKKKIYIIISFKFSFCVSFFFFSPKILRSRDFPGSNWFGFVWFTAS